MEPNLQPYFSRFKILGGGTVILPYKEIRRIDVDKENLRSKIYLYGEKAPITTTNTPEEIEQITSIYERI